MSVRAMKSICLCLTLAAPAVLAAAQTTPEATFKSYLGMGASLIEIHEPGKALAFFRRSAVVLPARVEPYREMARTLLSLGEVDEAAFWWREAHRRDPADKDLVALKSQFPEGKLAESTTGTVERIEVRFLGRSEFDGGGGDKGSIDAGQEIPREIVFAQAFDEKGRVVLRFEPQWSGSTGVQAEPAAAARVVARDPVSGKTGEASVRVLGRAASMRLFDVPTRKEMKEALYVGPGEKRSIRVLAQDAAGNALALTEYRWSAEREGTAVPEVLQTDVTYSSPEFPSEPVANVFRAPSAKEPTPFGIVVADPSTGVKGRAEVVVTPNAARAEANRRAIPWIDRFEEGLQAAATQGKLAIVEFQAPW